MAFLTPREALEMFGARPELLSLQSRLMAEYERRSGGKRTFVPADGGVRSNARQAHIDRVSQEKYPVASAGLSYHEYGAAFDLNTVGGYDGAGYELLAQIARELGLKPGADFGDEFHFQLNEPLSVVKSKWSQLQKKNWSSPRPRSSYYSLRSD